MTEKLEVKSIGLSKNYVPCEEAIQDTLTPRIYEEIGLTLEEEKLCDYLVTKIGVAKKVVIECYQSISVKELEIDQTFSRMTTTYSYQRC